jgi:hypothetical protein
MVPSHRVLRFLGGLCLATAASAQAIVEYAAKSAAGAASRSGSDLYLGACPVDRTLIPCVRHLYPLAFQIVMLSIFVFLAAALVVRNLRRS